MKIAILLPGHIRTYNNVRKNIFEYLINPLANSGNICDVFSSVWENEGFRETGFNDTLADLSIIKDDSIMFEVEKFNSIFFKKYNIWKRHALTSPTTCRDAASMWYKIFKCYNLVLYHSKIINTQYDLIFKLRPDIVFLEPFNIDLIKNIPENTIFMPPWHGKYEAVTYKLMDQFAFGTFESMTKYCSVFYEIDNIINRDDVTFTGEGFLYSQLSHHNILIERCEVKYGLMRSNGVEIYHN